MTQWGSRGTLFLVFFLFTVSGLSATTVGPADDWAAALQAAPSHSTVYLSEGRYIGACGLVLSKNLSVVSLHGHERTMIDCQDGAGRHMHLVGSDAAVRLVGITFTSSRLMDGGCIFSGENSSLQVSNCNFTGCWSAGPGAAILANNSRVTIEDTLFADGETDASGGAIALFNSSASIARSSFSNCRALRNGGALSIDNSNLVLIDVDLKGNHAQRTGGGVHAGAQSTVEAMQFRVSGNSAQQNGGGVALAEGSALRASTGTRFVDNQGYMGGGIFATASSLHLSDGVEISSNIALEDGGGFAVFGSSSVTAQGQVEVHSNSAGDWGGGVMVDGGSSMVIGAGVNFLSNTASSSGGGLAVSQGSFMKAEGAIRIAGNSVDSWGGGLQVFGGSVLELGSGVVLEHNWAGNDGGAIALAIEGHTHLYGDVEVRGNFAVDKAGGHSTWEAVILISDGVVVADNVAGSSGAALMIDGWSTLQTWGGVRMENNVARTGDGGAIAAQRGSKVLVADSVLRNNSASGYGGAVHLEELDSFGCEINGSSLVGNTAGEGGTLYVTNSKVVIRGSAFESGTAVGNGGGVSGVLGARVVVLDSSVVDCASGLNGGGIYVTGLTNIHMAGSIRLERNHAGARGGGAHVQGGSTMLFDGGVLAVKHNRAGSQGGGLSYMSAVELSGTETVVFNNTAQEGGGVAGIGWNAELVVGLEHRLRVEENAAEVDGGGIALMNLARLKLSTVVCPPFCTDLINNGECDPECASRECNWDGGSCAHLMEDAAAGAAVPCDRSECEHWRELRGDNCYWECFRASCDWTGCPEGTANLKSCPLFDAITYDSLMSAPAPVTHVRAGGTAKGYGRCDGACSSSAQPALPAWCTDAACTVPAQDAGAEWCTTLDDGGKVYDLVTPSSEDTVLLGDSWGLCSSHPRLPGSGLDYNDTELRSILTMAPLDLVSKYPGCAQLPVQLVRNSARRHGGGIFKSSCDEVLEATGECFIGGLVPATAPAVIVHMAENKAGGSGGAIYYACHDLGACAGLLSAQVGLPTGHLSTRRAASAAADWQVVSLAGNEALGFGGDVASAPAKIVINEVEADTVPGSAVLQLNISVVDSSGARMRGTRENPLPYIVSVLICKPDEADCSLTSSLQPEILLNLAQDSEFTLTAEAEPQLALCPLNSLAVRARLALVGQLSTEPAFVNLNCMACQEAQSRREWMAGASMVYTCDDCQPDEYVVEANNPEHQCTQCPAGTECENGQLRGQEGSVWEADAASGLYLLRQCPPAHQLLNTSADGSFSHDNQLCSPCRVNQYIADQLAACRECPVGADCDGESVFGKVEGSTWERVGEAIRLVRCPPGYIIVRDDDVPTTDQCIPCPQDTYSLRAAVLSEPGVGEEVLVVDNAVDAASGRLCQECTPGATCPGGKDVVPRAGFWRRGGLEGVVGAEEAEVYRCPPSACAEGGECKGGRIGPVCGICSSGWAMGNGVCAHCTYSLEVFGVVTYVVLAIAGVTLYFVMSIQPLVMKSKKEVANTKEKGGIWRMLASLQSVWSQLHGEAGNARLILGYFKVMVSFFQMLSSFLYTFSVEWDITMIQLMEVSGIFSFNVFAFPGPSCLAKLVSHEGQLLIYTLAPLFVLFMLVAPGAITFMLSKDTIEEARKRRIIQAMVRPMQVWLFLIYPLMTYKTLSHFNCQHLSPDDEGEWLLISNYNIECPLRHPGGFLFLWSLAFGIIYPLGIPAIFYFSLRKYNVPHIGYAKRLDEVTKELVIMFQRRHMHDMEALTSLCTLLTRTDATLDFSTDIQTVRQCCPALYKELVQELGGAVDREGLAGWLQKHRALCVRSQLLRAFVNQHAREGALDLAAFTEVICSMVREQVLFEGSETFGSLTDDQLKRLLACKWHPAIRTAAPTQDRAEFIRVLSTQQSYKRIDQGQAPEPRETRLASVSSVESVNDRLPSTVDRVPSGDAPMGSPEQRSKVKRQELVEGVKGSLWAYEGVPRDELEVMFMNLVRRLELLGVIGHENLVWDGSSPGEELALAHLGFLFRGYRIGVWYWEFVEFARKLIFNALMVFIFPGSRSQLIVGFIIAAVFMLFSAKFVPHKDKRVAAHHFVASIALCTILLYAILIRLFEFGDPESGEKALQKIMSIVSLILCIIVATFPFIMWFLNSDYNPYFIVMRYIRLRVSKRVVPHGSPSPASETAARDSATAPVGGESAVLPRAVSEHRQLPDLEQGVIVADEIVPAGETRGQADATGWNEAGGPGENGADGPEKPAQVHVDPVSTGIEAPQATPFAFS